MTVMKKQRYLVVGNFCRRYFSKYSDALNFYMVIQSSMSKVYIYDRKTHEYIIKKIVKVSKL